MSVERSSMDGAQPIPIQQDHRGDAIPTHEKVYDQAYEVYNSDYAREVLRAIADFSRIEAFLKEPYREQLKFATITDLKKAEAYSDFFTGQARPAAIVHRVNQLRKELEAARDKLISAKAKAAKKDDINFNKKLAIITVIMVALLITLLVVFGNKLDFNANQYIGAGMLITAFPIAVTAVRYDRMVVQWRELHRQLTVAKTTDEIDEINKRLGEINKYFEKTD